MKGPNFCFTYKCNYRNFTKGTSMPIMNCLSCNANHVLRSVFQKDFSLTNWSFSKILNSCNKDPIVKLGSLGQNPLEYYTYLSLPWPCALIPVRVMGNCPSLEITLLATWNLGNAIFTLSILSWITHKNYSLDVNK